MKCQAFPQGLQAPLSCRESFILAPSVPAQNYLCLGDIFLCKMPALFPKGNSASHFGVGVLGSFPVNVGTGACGPGIVLSSSVDSQTFSQPPSSSHLVGECPTPQARVLWKDKRRETKLREEDHTRIETGCRACPSRGQAGSPLAPSSLHQRPCFSQGSSWIFSSVPLRRLWARSQFNPLPWLVRSQVLGLVQVPKLALLPSTDVNLIRTQTEVQSVPAQEPIGNLHPLHPNPPPGMCPKHLAEEGSLLMTLMEQR